MATPLKPLGAGWPFSMNHWNDSSPLVLSVWRIPEGTFRSNNHGDGEIDTLNAENNETLLYPENAQKLEEAILEYSSNDNSQIYPKSPLLKSKDSELSSNLQANGEIIR